MTILLKTDPLRPDRDIIRKAAEILLQHGIVAFPTETVYGLGAVAFYEDAVKKVFIAKMRPLDNPLIIHISDLTMLHELSSNISEDVYLLAKKFWPGPLTIVLHKGPKVPRVTTGGLEKVAVRMPAHPVASLLIQETGLPIAAPSANLSGRPSPTTAQHVIEDLYGRIDAIIDAGETIYGVESTIVDLTTDPPTLLRPGPYPVEVIEETIGRRITIPDFARGLGEAEVALAPGVKYRHYAPRSKLVLVEGGEREEVARALDELLRKMPQGKSVCLALTRETLEALGVHQSLKVFVLGSRNNMYEIAHNLFKILRELDRELCDITLTEGVEEKGLGLAVMNRLRKASYLRVEVSRVKSLSFNQVPF